MSEDDTWAPLDYPGGLIDGQWERRLWENLPQLRCIHCTWDTLRGIEAAREHMRTCPRCAPPAPEIVEEQPSPVLVADKNWTPNRRA